MVVASGGYPGKYARGQAISGLDEEVPGAYVFHAGTSFIGQQVVANGGRVLGVTASGKTIREAVDTAYKMVDKIHYDSCFCRRDIAHRALERE